MLDAASGWARLGWALLDWAGLVLRDAVLCALFAVLYSNNKTCHDTPEPHFERQS